LIKTCLKKGALAQADTLIDTLQTAYSAHPDYAGVVNDVGEACRGQKEYVRAINVYRMTLAAESSKENVLAACAGIAKAAVWLGNSTMDPNSFEVREMDQNTAVIAKADPNSPSANDKLIDSIIQKLMAYYEQTQRQDYSIFEIAEEYCFRAGDALSKGDRQQALGDFSRAIEIWQKNISLFADSGYQCLVCYFTANTYQHMEYYEDAISHYQQVLNQWTQFDRNWFAQYMIAKCYNELFSNGIISQEEAKFQVIKACRELEEQYPDSKASVPAQKLLTKYEAL
jgi:tetratricopeptide (TPR) repeat protein